jgi:hypothetical protein
MASAVLAILPVYAGLFACGLLAGLVLRLLDSRRTAGFVWAGTLGTIPGFALANVLFWALFDSVAALGRLLLGHFGGPEGLHQAAAILLTLFMIGGLLAANIIGCGLGFLVGCLLYGRNARSGL